MENTGVRLWEILDKMLYTIFVRFLHLKFLEKRWDGFMQFVKFGVVGVTNTVISYTLNVLVLFACAKLHIFERYDYILGNTIAFLLSVLWSFYWNSRYVFGLEEGEKRSPWKALLKTYISYGFTGIILSNILSYVWIRVFGISKYLAPLINLVVSIPVNFLMNKLWAFKGEKTEA